MRNLGLTERTGCRVATLFGASCTLAGHSDYIDEIVVRGETATGQLPV